MRARAYALWLLWGLAVPSLGEAQVDLSRPAPGVQLVYGVNGGNPTALVVVDLCAPGVSVRTTRYEERGALAVDWAARTGVDVAINGDLFDFGAYSVGHWARSGGMDWPPGTHNQEPQPNVAFGPGFAMRGDLPPPAAATDVVGGIPEFVLDGQLSTTLPDTDFINGPHRRSAVGLSRDRRTLFLFSTDGTASVPGEHFGMSVFAHAAAGSPEVWWALNLDGGGSSQLFVRGRGVVIPSTRPVANHLGIFARGTGPATHCPAPDPRCPAAGLGHYCADRTRVSECFNGVYQSTGDCAAYGAVCAPLRPGEPGCVLAFCLPDPSRAPFDHDACGFDGRLTHCTAAGGVDNPRACPAGTTCQTRADGTGLCAPPGTVGADAAVLDVLSGDSAGDTSPEARAGLPPDAASRPDAAGPEPTRGGACACRAGVAPTPSGLWGLALLALGARRSSRRRLRSRSSGA